MADFMTNRAKKKIADGSLDLDTSDIRVGLLVVSPDATLPAGAINPDLNTVSDLLAVSTVLECTVSGYARVALTTKTATQDDVNDRCNVTSDVVTFTALSTGQTIRGAFTYLHTGSDATGTLISVTNALNTPTNGGNVTATVIYRLT